VRLVLRNDIMASDVFVFLRHTYGLTPVVFA